MIFYTPEKNCVPCISAWPSLGGQSVSALLQQVLAGNPGFSFTGLLLKLIKAKAQKAGSNKRIRRLVVFFCMCRVLVSYCDAPGINNVTANLNMLFPAGKLNLLKRVI
jgi:hypothetical protein